MPGGFQESVVFSGLTNPTAVRFAADGRVFVAEKSGVIKVFDNLADTTPTIFADLQRQRPQLLGPWPAGHGAGPELPDRPVRLRPLHLRPRARLGRPGAALGHARRLLRPLPDPAGATADGCVVSGRLSRLQAAGNVMTGSEQVLVEDWCQQYPSHSIGTLEFGPDGALYASGGDGASFNFVDYGQDGSPVNPCGDPPGGPGAALTPPTAEGGALRSQDLRTSRRPGRAGRHRHPHRPGDRRRPAGNPLASAADPNARRIIAYGLRNPFRFTSAPAPTSSGLGDVGWNDWEEINRIANPTDARRELRLALLRGHRPPGGYDGANLNICENLYAPAGRGHRPVLRLPPQQPGRARRDLPDRQLLDRRAGVRVRHGGSLPGEYDGALFFADYSRDCIWVMPKGAERPARSRPGPDLRRRGRQPGRPGDGPGGDLFYVDFDGGTIRRIQLHRQPAAHRGRHGHAHHRLAPRSRSASTARGSSDPDGDTLTYAWDLDGDGAFDDSTTAQATLHLHHRGTYTVKLRVTDSQGAVRHRLGDDHRRQHPPDGDDHHAGRRHHLEVGDVITFSGSATDAQDGTLPASALTWELILHHCPSNCHAHPLQTFTGVAGGSFTAPDHEYPSYLELRLTATDSGGLTDTRPVRLDPRTVVLTFQTNPGGLSWRSAGRGDAPFTRTVIVGSTQLHQRDSPADQGRQDLQLPSWSDGGAQTHNIIAPATATTYTAPIPRYAGLGARAQPQTAPWSAPPTRVAYLARAPRA